jgi:hypothetical protein
VRQWDRQRLVSARFLIAASTDRKTRPMNGVVTITRSLHVEAGPDVDAEFARLAEEEEQATIASPPEFPPRGPETATTGQS